MQDFNAYRIIKTGLFRAAIITDIQSADSQSLKQHTMAVIRYAVDGRQPILGLALLRGHFSPATHDWLFNHSVLCNDVTRLFLHVECVII
jgi:hypothetical protein